MQKYEIDLEPRVTHLLGLCSFSKPGRRILVGWIVHGRERNWFLGRNTVCMCVREQLTVCVQ